MPFDFPRSLRLTQRKQFDHVFEAADGRVGVHGLLCIWRSNELDHARIGLTVSKKTMRNAIRRNRIRRIIREQFRLRHADLPAVDLIIIVRRDFPVTSPDQWAALSDSLFQRIIRRLSPADT